MLLSVARRERYHNHGCANVVRRIVRCAPRLAGAVRHQLHQEVGQAGLTSLPLPADREDVSDTGCQAWWGMACAGSVRRAKCEAGSTKPGMLCRKQHPRQSET